MLGSLSSKIRDRLRGPGTVSSGAGDADGVSYGSYQMTSQPAGGGAARFIADPTCAWRERFVSLRCPAARSSAPSGKHWPPSRATRYFEAQAPPHPTDPFSNPLVRKIDAEDSLNVTRRSHALQDVIWSTAVGAARRARGPSRDPPPGRSAALCCQLIWSATRQLIVAIYAERSRRNADGFIFYLLQELEGGAGFRFPEVKIDEGRDALRMLESQV